MTEQQFIESLKNGLNAMIATLIWVRDCPPGNDVQRMARIKDVQKYLPEIYRSLIFLHNRRNPSGQPGNEV